MKKFLKLLLGFSFFVIFTNSYAIEYPFICENDDSQCKKTVSQTITNVNQTYKYLKVLSFDNDNNQTYEDAENAKPYQTFPNGLGSYIRNKLKNEYQFSWTYYNGGWLPITEDAKKSFKYRDGNICVGWEQIPNSCGEGQSSCGTHNGNCNERKRNIKEKFYTFAELLDESNLKIWSGNENDTFNFNKAIENQQYNGFDYVLSNFLSIVNDYNDIASYDVDARKSIDLSSLLKMEIKTCNNWGYYGNCLSYNTELIAESNVISYSNGKFNLMRVCDNETCSTSSQKSVSYSDANSIKLLRGVAKNGSISIALGNADESTSLSSLIIKAGDSVNANLSFTRIIEQTGYTELEYSVYYKNQGSTDEIVVIIPTEKIKIKNDDLKNSTTTIYSEAKGDYISFSDYGLPNNEINITKKFNSINNKVGITLNTTTRIQKTGQIQFYIKIKVDNGDSNDYLLGEGNYLTVINADDLSGTEIKIVNSEVDDGEGGTKDRLKVGYNKGDTINIEVSPKDKYGNEYCDTGTGGYQFSLNIKDTDGTSKDANFNLNNTGIITNTDNSNCLLKFTIQGMEEGDYSIGFNIKTRIKGGVNSYKNPPLYQNTTDIKIQNGLLPQGTSVIFITPAQHSDVKFTCGNKDVFIPISCDNDVGGSTCAGDQGSLFIFTGNETFSLFNVNDSYIRNGMQNSSLSNIVYTDVNWNNFKTKYQIKRVIHNGEKEIEEYTKYGFTLITSNPISYRFKDKAGNIWSRQLFMNHIDIIPPTIKMFKGDTELTASSGSYKAADDFKLELFEETTNTCLDGDVETGTQAQIDASKDYFEVTLKINNETINKTIEFSGGVLIEGGGEVRGEDGKYGIKYTLDLSKRLTKAGTYNIKITNLQDKYGNKAKVNGTDISASTPFTKFITIYPTDEDLLDNDKWAGPNDGYKFWNLTVIGSDVYANNKDFYQYTLTLRDKYGNAIYNKNLKNIKQQEFSESTGRKTICLNATIESCISALNPSALNFSGTTMTLNSQGKGQFKLLSFAPGTFSQVFKADLDLWNDNYNNNGTTKEIKFNIIEDKVFLKPIAIQDIKVSNGTGNLCSGPNDDWQAYPDTGKLQRYRIILSNSGQINTESGLLDISRYNIKDKEKGHIWEMFGTENKTFSGVNIQDVCLGFEGRIGLEDNALSSPKIVNGNPNDNNDDNQIDDLPITYELEGENVSYYLDQFTKTGACQNKSTLGVKVIGTLQSDGKADQTGQEENFSDLSTSEMRGIIKKNATQLVRGMSGGETDDPINGVKYVDYTNVDTGTYEISSIDYETLIVKNGNVFIKNDLNTNGKVLGIIVLKDNYNVNTDYNQAGNVYIAKNVENINAVIYADGALRSAKVNGNEYEDAELQKTLDIKGSVFSRNTIGGATKLAGKNYLLPGGKSTTLNLAEKYDLNYIRKVSLCNLDDYSVKITYDSRIQTNPPKGFSK